MEVNSRPAIFLSAKGVKKRVDTKPISSEELGINREYFPGIMDGVKRSLLGFDYLEVEADVLGKIEIIELEEMQYLEKFKNLGKREFLREMNEIAFLDLCEKINDLNEKVFTLYQSENKNLEANIELLTEKIRDYKKIKSEFGDWFFSNHLDVPILPQHKHLLKSTPEKTITGNQNDLKVTISNFDTLELIIPKHIEPGNKVSFRLKGLSDSTESLKLPQMQGAFLMYLMMERKEGMNLWMLNPEKHIDKLQEITDLLELPIKYDDAIQENFENTFTWFNDDKNGFRKTMASLVNKNLNNNGKIVGSLIYNVPKSVSGAYAIYTLAKTIKKTDIVIFQK